MFLPKFKLVVVPRVDMRGEIVAAASSATLCAVADRLSESASHVAALSKKDPAAAAESIRKLSLEISNALVRAAADCDAEDFRRKFVDVPSKFADTPTVKLHEPETDDGIESPIEPVGASVRGVPVPQSDRTGA